MNLATVPAARAKEIPRAKQEIPRTKQEIPQAARARRLAGTLAFRRDPIGFLQAGIDECGDIFRFKLLGPPVTFINHPDYIREVLADNGDTFDKNAAIFRIVRPVLRDGLISVADLDVWRRQRRLMAPYFTPRTVSTFAENMTDETVQMLDRWERSPGVGGVIDVTAEAGHLALRIVSRSLFSAEVGSRAQTFERAFCVANSMLGAYLRLPFPPLAVPTRAHLRLRRAIARMDEFVSTSIRERLAGHASAGNRDLLTLLMHAADEDGRMDPAQLHDEVLNVCIGAFETTRNTLSWALDVLARHPEVERNLHTELDQVLAGRIPTVADFAQLTYTRAIIDETLRLYSPAYQSMRHAVTDTEIGGYAVPANSDILFNSYLLHRHPEFWEKPERFDPTRFTPDRVAARPKHAYIPFGSGPRSCIGKHFALTELTLALATIGRGHRLVRPAGRPDVALEPLITLQPRGGVHLMLQRR
jgi:cytochrome P450